MLFDKYQEVIEAVIYIAVHSHTKPVSSRVLCQRHNVSKRHFEPVMQALVHEGVLRGAKGPRGGYSLAKEKRKITAGEIFRVVQSLESHNKTTRKTRLNQLVIRPHFKLMKKHLLQYLDTITLEELCQRAVEIYCENDEVKGDFSI